MSKLLRKESGTVQGLVQTPMLLPIAQETEALFRDAVLNGFEWSKAFGIPETARLELDFYRETGEFEVRIYEE